MKIAVVGGGISGLAAAYRLRRAGHEAVVLEADARLGGKVQSERDGDWLVEHGPNGFLDSRVAVVRLARDVGLGDRLAPAEEAAERRYLVVDGRLKAVPTSPPAFLASDVLSARGKLRMLREPLVPPRKVAGDESVYRFAARRVGAEAAEKLVDPLVTGIYAGDVHRLSLPAAFPRLRALEAEHGGLVRGMVAKVWGRVRGEAGDGAGPSGPGGRLTSFPGGMGELVAAVAGAMERGAVQVGRPVTGLSRKGGRWVVAAGGGDPLVVDGVVLTAPAPVVARLLAPHAPGATGALDEIPYAAAAVVALGYRVVDIPRPLDGFGFLVPSREGRRVLGVLWSSTIFRGRAPGGYALLRCIVGGRRHPELLGLDDEALVGVVRAELASIFGANLAAPGFSRVVRWPAAIPQYELGHLDRKAAAEAAVRGLPGLWLGGNALYGVSLADCVARAEALPEIVGGAG
ncbi:MAG: protoporphyrinogen oxidase [Myxococcales bacterium]|nr:protoporphyrinogen oxidase [Myxococcales bacterium]